MPRISAHQQQMQLDFHEPFDHHQQLHRSPHGVVLVWEQQKSEKRWSKIRQGDSVPELVSVLAGKQDTYMSVNQFANWRTIDQLRSLRACYVDIDGCIDLQLALELLREKSLPAPSFVVFSGRGMHFYWTLQATPAKALPVWQQVQDWIGKSLASIGSDPRARDCARVLRLVGTINSKNDAVVRGVVLTGQEWTLHELADEVLGKRKPKPQIFDFAAGAARQGRKVGTGATTGSIYIRWHIVYEDLCKIAQFNYAGGVGEGQRNNFLFLMSVALSWFAHADILEDEIGRTARKFTPTLTEREIKEQMACVMVRAKEADAGETRVWVRDDGREVDVDPRYRFSSDKMREMLGDLIHPDLHEQLRALAPAELIAKRKSERDSARWSDKNTGEGIRLGNVDKRSTARLMKAKGLTDRAIAADLGVSHMTIQRWTK